jgi:hypothetical protein
MNSNLPSYQEITDALFAAYQVGSLDTAITMIRGLSSEDTILAVARLVEAKREEENNNEEIRNAADFLIGLLNPND